MNRLFKLHTLQTSSGSDPSSFHRRPIHQHSTPPRFPWLHTSSDRDRVRVLLCYWLWHVGIHICIPEWLPSHHVPNSSTCVPDPVFGGFSAPIKMWCVHVVIMIWIRLSHPSLPAHIHRSHRFTMPHEWARSMTSSGKGSTGSGSFQANTISCSSAFGVSPQSGLVWWLAFELNTWYEYYTDFN